MLSLIGQTVLLFPVILEINLIVDLVGLTELLKLWMTENVSKKDLILLFYLLLILLPVVVSSIVSLWVVTEVKLVAHGLGSRVTESLPVETSVMILLVIHTLCLNATIMLKIQNIKAVLMLKKLIHNAIKNVQVMVLIMNQTNNTENPLME